MIADAIKRAGGTDPEKMVTAMEATNYVGTIGTIAFAEGRSQPACAEDRQGVHHRPDAANGRTASR